MQVRGIPRNLVVCFFSTSRRRPEKTAWPAVGVHRIPGQVQMAVDPWAPLLLFSVNRAPPVGAFPAGQVAPRHPGPHCVLRPAPVARATICRVVRLGEQPSSWTGFHYPLACLVGTRTRRALLTASLQAPLAQRHRWRSDGLLTRLSSAGLNRQSTEHVQRSTTQ